jgi:hypothetical protein
MPLEKIRNRVKPHQDSVDTSIIEETTEEKCNGVYESSMMLNEVWYRCSFQICRQ